MRSSRTRATLYAFVSDTPGVKNYYDVLPGSGTVVAGHWIPVPKNIATGKNADGSEIKAADVGFPPPPTNGSWQRDLRSVAPVGLDGPQWVLEYWSDINNVFQFVRVEDLAYDKRAGQENVAYIVDSGRGRRVAESQDTPNFKSTNGRVWKMVFDPNDPTVVTSLTVFVEGDDNPVQTLDEVHQPDNIETTATGVLLTEDPGSSQQFPVGSTDRDRHDRPHLVRPVHRARRRSSPRSTSPRTAVRPTSTARLRQPGSWEASGIVDASAAFGPGAYLVSVQAHTLWVEKAPGEDNIGDARTGLHVQA